MGAIVKLSTFSLFAILFQNTFFVMTFFTCLSCRVVFSDADLQRDHYKSEWHRYNLKRKVAELPPITAENFQQRIEIQKIQSETTPEPEQAYRELCSKHFKQRSTYNNHLNSKKHIDLQTKLQRKQRNHDEKQKEKGLQETDLVSINNAKNTLKTEEMNTNTLKIEQMNTNEDSDDDAESMEDWSGDALGIEECLFCSKISETLEDNLAHMSRVHSFFIPDIEYVCDLPSLITYLGQKVGEGKICLWCNEHGRSFNSVKSVQQHMIAKGHTKMLHEGDAVFEYADFYDYRSSYPDFAECASSSQSIADTDETEEEEVTDLTSILMEDFQLVLPSGATIGHRSLQRYYRQSLNPRRDVCINPAQRVIAQYKGLGWTGTSGTVAEKQKRAKDVHFVQRLNSRHNLKMRMKNNKLLQHHFRPQVIF